MGHIPIPSVVGLDAFTKTDFYSLKRLSDFANLHLDDILSLAASRHNSFYDESRWQIFIVIGEKQDEETVLLSAQIYLNTFDCDARRYRWSDDK
jgi:hypothetical protein